MMYVTKQAGCLTYVPPALLYRPRTLFLCRASCRIPRRRIHARHITRACSPLEEKGVAKMPEVDVEKPKPTISRTEEVAALLGQDREELKARSDKVMEAKKLSDRKKYGLALASAVISVSLFCFQRLDPNGSANLMEYLRMSSAPVEVVGTSGMPTVIEFSAKWCENCKYMARRVFELKGEYSGRVNFIVVDGDDPAMGDIVDKYSVDAIPQFSLIDSRGEVITNLVGLVPKEALSSDLDAMLKSEPLPYTGVVLKTFQDFD